MALITCKECGQQISDKATTCIHCGCPLNEAGNDSLNVLNEEQNDSLSSSADYTTVIENIENESVNEIPNENDNHKKLKLSKKLVIIASSILLACIIGIGGFFIIQSQKMSVLDQSIYDALVIATQDMKNPSGMQVLQVGTVRKNDNDGKMISCVIKVQSTTLTGATNTDELLLTSDGTFTSMKDWQSGLLSAFADKLNDMYDINDNNENVNVKKINSALKRHWKDLGIE